MTKSILTLIALAALMLTFAARAQEEPEPGDDGGNGATDPQSQDRAGLPNNGAETNGDNEELVSELMQAVLAAQQALQDAQAGRTNGRLDEARSPRAIRGQGTRGTAGSGTNAVSLTALLARNGTNQTAAADQTLRLNFRNAPLSLVLDYLSEAAGFTISANSKVDLKGTVTVWSNRPVGRNEAIQVLDESLKASGYGATVEGSLLNIFVVDPSTAPIVAGIPNNDYTTIAPTKDLVTQIVYVNNVEANQLIQTLQPLMPGGTSMTANQGANAIVITDTKANIRRMAQLVKALDTASVSQAGMRVFPLDYADATALAQVVTQLFQPTDTGNQNNRGRFGGLFPGGFPGGGGDRGRGDNAGGGGGSQSGRVAAPKVTAVADERSNSLVVSASAEQLVLIEELVRQMDVNVDDLAVLRVFRLRYADPQETADQLVSLFPDPTLQQNTRNRQGGFRGFGGNNANRTATTPSTRSLQQTKVTAVPDPRTGSVIVSAAQQMMPQIADIIEELDSDPAKKKRIHVIKVENRDPQTVVEELQSIIAQDTSAGTLNNTRNTTRQTGSQLNTRQQNNLQNQRNTQGNFGTGNRQFGNN